MDLPSPWRLATGGVACLIALAVLAAADWTPALPQIPAWFSAQAPWAIDAALVLNTIGRGVVLVPLTAAIAVVLLAVRRRWWAAYIVTSGLLGLAIVEVTKQLLDRPRPQYALVREVSASFPSGHAAAGIYSWVVFGIAAWHLLPQVLPRALGRGIAVTAIVIGVLLGPSRLVLGVHYLGDILGGWAAGGAATLLMAALVIGVRTGSWVARVRPGAGGVGE